MKQKWHIILYKVLYEEIRFKSDFPVIYKLSIVVAGSLADISVFAKTHANSYSNVLRMSFTEAIKMPFRERGSLSQEMPHSLRVSVRLNLGQLPANHYSAKEC